MLENNAHVAHFIVWKPSMRGFDAYYVRERDITIDRADGTTVRISDGRKVEVQKA
jgi:hypothetical protein